MFNSIRGIVGGKGGEAVFILSGDIEWEIAMPLNDIQSLSLNGECRVFTWLYHREDQMKLFGFCNEKRRDTFLELIKVEGIGPKGALKIMSGISQGDLERALETEDLARLETVPGLGKKTAQKMLLSLKGKIVQTREIDSVSSPYNELVEALVDMGYDRRQAARALVKAESSVTSDLPADEKEKLIFKEAILRLSGA
jgi:Holliday junction DNA helicase RuvA